MSGMYLVQILTKRVLKKDETEKFKFKILKTKERRIRIGIVDRLKQR